MAVDLVALTVIPPFMPASAVNEEEDLRVQRAQEREQQERRDERPPRRRWLTVVQVLAVIVAMVLAVYNNALINQLPAPNDDEVAWLTISETMEPVAPCNQGGVRLFTGFDTNGNGILDLAERGEPFEMCHGLQGLSGPQGQPGNDGANAVAQLVNTTTIPVGNATCPEGGTWMASGLDLDGNGSLDENEVVTQSAMCNGLVGQHGVDGTAGASGAAGASALVDKVAAPSYVCLDGFQVRFGIDDGLASGTANDGVLDEDEVRATLNFCFQPLRHERITDVSPNIADSFTVGCDASAWLADGAHFVFAANDGVNGCELHHSDGEANTSTLLLDLHPSGDGLPGRDLGFHVLDERLVFFDATDGVNGRELWVSDGTANGTRALGSVEIKAPVAWNQGLVFASPSGSLVWTNGTDLLPWWQHPAWNSTQQSAVQNTLSTLTNPGAGWLHGDEHALWFSAADAQGDVEPHRLTNAGVVSTWNVNAFGSAQLSNLLSDEHDLIAVGLRGTAKQVVRLLDNGSVEWLTSIAPSSGDTRLAEGMGLHRIGDNLVYDAVTFNNEARLWTTNLANGISLQLSTDILAPGAQVGVANTGERLLFDCVTSTYGVELCVSDATPAGSRVLHDLTPGVLSSDVRGMVAIGEGWAVFSDGTHEGASLGRTLWVVEGDAVRPVYNPWPGAGNSSQALTYGDVVVSPTQLFFIAHDGIHGHEWHRWSHGELSDDWIVIAR